MEQVMPQVKKRHFSTKLKLAVVDIIEGFKSWRIWLAFARQDIQHRYRRSVLGPIWITLSTSLMIYSLGYIYGSLLKADLKLYFPFISTGIVIWTFISATILELTDTLVENSHFIRQIKLPFTVYILRVLIRNYIVLAHNMIALVPLLIYFKIQVHILAAFFGFFVITVAAISFGMILAIFGVRFRDFKPIIQNMMQLVFYVTPIMWMPEMISQRIAFVVNWNPLYQLVELLRAPLLGKFPSTYCMLFALSMTMMGLILMICLFARFRHRIAFWI